MSEKKVMLPPKTIEFEGSFHLKTIIQTIQSAFADKGYAHGWQEHDISVTDEKKTHTQKFTFSRKESDYDKAVISVTISASGVPGEVTVYTHKYSGIIGTLKITFSGIRKSEREGNYTINRGGKKNAVKYFFSRLYRKYVKATDLDVAGTSIKSDVTYVIDKIELVMSNG